MSLFEVPAPLIAIIVFFLLIGFYILGHFLRIKFNHIYSGKNEKELGTISGTLLGLLALFLAFTFGTANNRFDDTRQLVKDEANAISTAIKRSEIYPDSVNNELKEALKNYVELRIHYYEVGYLEDKIYKVYLQSCDSLNKIWSIASEFNRHENNVEIRAQLLPAICEMMNVATARIVARESTVPPPMLYFLFALSFSAAFLMGYERVGKIDWVIIIGFTLMLTLTIYAILDIDRPRRGLITLNKVHRHIYELRDAF